MTSIISSFVESHIHGTGPSHCKAAAAYRDYPQVNIATFSRDPLLVDTMTACKLLSIRRTLLFEYLRRGILVRRKVGRKTLVTMDSIRALAEGRPEGNDDSLCPISGGIQVTIP